MYPLIEIQTVPIKIKMTTKDAQLQYTRGTAEMEVSRGSGGGLKIKSRPIQLKMDTFEARNSITPTTVRSIEQYADEGKQSAYEATSAYAEQGKLYLNAKLGQDVVNQVQEQRTANELYRSSVMEFLPKEGVDIQWDEGEMEIQYEMDKLNFDWKIEQGEFEFTPGNIEISVEQHPDVIIKYIGGPFYVPPSAAPDYEPVNIEV